MITNDPTQATSEPVVSLVARASNATALAHGIVADVLAMILDAELAPAPAHHNVKGLYGLVSHAHGYLACAWRCLHEAGETKPQGLDLLAVQEASDIAECVTAKAFRLSGVINGLCDRETASAQVQS